MRDNLWDDLIKALNRHENKRGVSRIGLCITSRGTEIKQEYDLVCEVCLEVVKINDKLTGKSHSKKRSLGANHITRDVKGELKLTYHISPWGSSESIVFDQSWFTEEGRKEIDKRARKASIERLEQQADTYLLRAGKLLERIEKLKKENDEG